MKFLLAAAPLLASFARADIASDISVVISAEYGIATKIYDWGTDLGSEALGDIESYFDTLLSAFEVVASDGTELVTGDLSFGELINFGQATVNLLNALIDKSTDFTFAGALETVADDLKKASVPLENIATEVFGAIDGDCGKVHAAIQIAEDAEAALVDVASIFGLDLPAFPVPTGC